MARKIQVDIGVNVKGSAGGAAAQGRAAANAVKAPPRGPGGFATVAQAQAAMNAALPGAAAGNLQNAAIVNRARAAIRAQQRAVAPPKSGNDGLSAFLRTRFLNVGGKMAALPLGRDLGAMASMMSPAVAGMMGGGAGGAGALAALGPAGVALGGAFAVVAAQVTAFGVAVKTAQESLNFQMATGGTAGQAGAAMRVRNAGLGDASAVMGNAASGGIASAVAASMGISPVRGAMGEMNDARDMVRLLREIRGMSAGNAARAARALGAPEIAKVRLLDDDTFRRLTTAMSGQSVATSRASAGFDANASALGEAVARVLGEGSAPGMQAMADIMGATADIVNAFDDELIFVLKMQFGALQALAAVMKGLASMIPGATDAIRNQERAARENTRALRDGTIGGGERTRQATADATGVRAIAGLSI